MAVPTGIVTGASRGLGLALTRALAEHGWLLTVDARDGSGLEQATATLKGVVAIAGDVADPEHRRALVQAAGEPIHLLVNNASLLGPSPQPALADYALTELERVFAVICSRRWRWPSWCCLAWPRRRDRQRHLRRRRRGLRRLGRVRVVQGGARTADGDLRRRAPRAAGLQRRSRRHAHADAPGRVPGRGHQRPAAPRKACPGCSRSSRVCFPAAATRPVTSR